MGKRGWLLTRIGPIVGLLALAAPSLGQESRSAKVAAELRQALSEQKLTMVAAQVPNQTDTFVAASYVPRVGLLLISARSSSPAFLADCVRRRAYKDAYSFLHGTSLPDGKFFVQDAGADGLRASRRDTDTTVDVTWQNVTKRVVFDGDPAKQRMTEAEYRAAFEAQDARYARLLTILVEELKRPKQSPEAER
jgi:hypothetical protein